MCQEGDGKWIDKTDLFRYRIYFIVLHRYMRHAYGLGEHYNGVERLKDPTTAEDDWVIDQNKCLYLREGKINASRVSFIISEHGRWTLKQKLKRADSFFWINIIFFQSWKGRWQHVKIHN